ncbi:4-hydroxythreonine-4-phosphate dehydrogenase PdxA [Bradyrhizobium sp. 200]|uniref:4-hydroxythreonine-4-phosphate dehydrogenase PdxA n=1 Tax=Bradyrhizobium sp. 200 TaxID=2782665 RepID=UPI0020986264|nr:4-hydroxythreonine-4-phosphate dehydrogenase PdxA [Bradyrhizobium sp. 200]
MAGRDDIRVILIGDEHVIRHYGERHAGGTHLQQAGTSSLAVTGGILFHAVDALPSASFRPGHIDAAAGRATVAYLEAAVGLVRGGAADAIVGCPHNEMAVNAAGIPFSGYPGLIAGLTRTPEDKVFMMLVGGGLRILHATLHERIHPPDPRSDRRGGHGMCRHLATSWHRKSANRHFWHQPACRREWLVRRRR